MLKQENKLGEFGHSDVQIYSPVYLEHKGFSEVNMYTKKVHKVCSSMNF